MRTCFRLVICRMVNLSLEHGNSDASCFAYVWLGMIAGPHFGDYQAGFRFGQLGYELVEQRGLDALPGPDLYDLRQARHAMDETCPGRPRSGAPRVRGGEQDRRPHLCGLQLQPPEHEPSRGGRSARDVQREAENGLAFAQKVRFGLVIDVITAQLGLIRTLRGLTPTFGSLRRRAVRRAPDRAPFGE